MKQPSHHTVATHPPRLYLLPALVAPRRTLSPRSGYAVAALVVGLGLFASVTPSPLYRTYSVLWHFSPLTLTIIYATYAFGVLASLLLAGGVSDEVGRRPVLLAALGALMASEVAESYGEVGRIPDALSTSLTEAFEGADAPNPHDVAEAITELVGQARGSRAARTVVGAPFGSDEANEGVAPAQAKAVEALGLSHLERVA
jgi:hypothetical protein